MKYDSKHIDDTKNNQNTSRSGLIHLCASLCLPYNKFDIFRQVALNRMQNIKVVVLRVRICSKRKAAFIYRSYKMPQFVSIATTPLYIRIDHMYSISNKMLRIGKLVYR